MSKTIEIKKLHVGRFELTDIRLTIRPRFKRGNMAFDITGTYTYDGQNGSMVANLAVDIDDDGCRIFIYAYDTIDIELYIKDDLGIRLGIGNGKKTYKFTNLDQLIELFNIDAEIAGLKDKLDTKLASLLV